MFGLSQTEIAFKDTKDVLDTIILLLIESGIITKEQFIKKFDQVKNSKWNQGV